MRSSPAKLPPVMEKLNGEVITRSHLQKSCPKMNGMRISRSFIGKKTEPITIGEKFAGGNKDDSYYASSIMESQETEREVFYDEGVIEQKIYDEPRKSRGLCCCNGRRESKAKKTQTVVKRNTKIDTEKLDKILVGIYLTWDDDKFDTLFPKLNLLVDLKADINTTWGAGIFEKSLLERTFYSKHEKLRHGLINMVDSKLLEPIADQSLFSLACEMCNYNTMELLLAKNCEPNRIARNGTTPLMKLCKYSTHKDGDTDYAEQLKCIELLVNFEGPDAKTLKAKWIRKWEKKCPESIGNAWHEIADFCIPNVNVRPSANGNTAEDHLLHYNNSELFITRGKQLLNHLFDDVRCNKEKYWPRDRNEYKKQFKSNWE